MMTLVAGHGSRYDMAPVTVMHVITRLDMGGSARNTLLTCLGLNREKYRVILVAGLTEESRMSSAEARSVESGIAEARQRGVVVIRVPELVRSIHPLRDVLALASLWRIIRREKPDIVHTHTSKAGILGRWAARLAGVPTIIHTPHGHVFYGHFAALFSRLFFLTEKLTAPLTHRVVALTRGERDDYLSLGLFPDERLTVIHSGVPIESFADVRVDAAGTRRDLGIPEAAIVVGTVGWLLPIKNPLALLEAMAPLLEKRPDLYLVFVGQGDLAPALKRRAAELGAAERVLLTGWRPDIPELMGVFDIFALTSQNEGMGRVVVEAMASGKPVVAGRVGGIPDLVVHGENGFLVAPRDSAALGAAIKTLVDNAALRDRMGEEGRKTAARFSLSTMIERLEALYDSFPGGRA